MIRKASSGPGMDELPGISRILLCIPTDASSRGVDQQQECLFTTLVILRARITQTSLVFIDALRTDAASGFSAYIAGHDWRGISGKYLDSSPLPGHLLLRKHFHCQFCGRPEFLFLGTRLPWPEYFV
jgi:hypothetical protein